MTAKLRWIVAIVALLGGNVVAMLILMISASAQGAQVIPDYYERAAHYDRTLDEAATSRALGWRVERSGRQIEVRDVAGQRIANVVITGYPRAHAARRFEARDGRVPDGVHGWCDVTVTAERDGARFVQQVAVELP